MYSLFLNNKDIFKNIENKLLDLYDVNNKDISNMDY